MDIIDIEITIENSKNDVDIIFMTVFWKGVRGINNIKVELFFLGSNQNHSGQKCLMDLENTPSRGFIINFFWN